MPRIDGKEQLEILAVVEGRCQTAARGASKGNLRGVDFKSDPAPGSPPPAAASRWTSHR